MWVVARCAVRGRKRERAALPPHSYTINHDRFFQEVPLPKTESPESGSAATKILLGKGPNLSPSMYSCHVRMRTLMPLYLDEKCGWLYAARKRERAISIFCEEDVPLPKTESPESGSSATSDVISIGEYPNPSTRYCSSHLVLTCQIPYFMIVQNCIL